MEEGLFGDNSGIIFLISPYKHRLWVLIIGCGYSLEAPRGGASNEYPQPMFLWRTGEKYSKIITKYSYLTNPLYI